jgi:hypothetical protein
MRNVHHKQSTARSKLEIFLSSQIRRRVIPGVIYDEIGDFVGKIPYLGEVPSIVPPLIIGGLMLVAAALATLIANQQDALLGGDPNSEISLILIVGVCGTTSLVLYLGDQLYRLSISEHMEPLLNYIQDEQGFKSILEFIQRHATWKRQFGVSLFFVLLGVLAVRWLEVGSNEIPVYWASYVVVGLTCFIVGGTGLYVVVVAPHLLKLFLDQNLRFYPVTPSESTVIRSVRKLISRVLIAGSIMASFISIILALLIAHVGDVANVIGIMLVAVAWVAFSYVFFACNFVIGQAMFRIEQDNIGELQQSVDELYTRLDVLAEDEIARLSLKVDLIDRLVTSSSSGFRFDNATSYIASLLLPVMSFLIGNLDWLSVVNRMFK